MSGAVILVETEGPVATVTLNRPQARNALSTELRKALWQAMSELDGDDEIAAVVLTGTDPSFCAGLDLEELAEDIATNDPTGVRQILRTYDEGGLVTAGEAWVIEGRFAGEWHSRGRDGDDIEARRRAVTERGRSQV